MKNLKKILFLLNPRERKKSVLLLLLISIMAFLDMVGVASILPFISVLQNPQIIETNIILNKIYNASSLLGVENYTHFFFALGFFVFFLLLFSLIFKAGTTYFQIHFIQMCQYNIGKRLLEVYLSQPYTWFLNQHSADLGKNILSEVGTVVGNGISPLIELCARGMVSIAIIILLIIVDPKLAFYVTATIGSAYGLIFYFSRNYLNLIGKKRLISNEERFKSLSEAFGATKEIKAGGLEKIYINRFSDSAKIFAKTTSSAGVIRQLPRYSIEALSFGGILLVILYLISESGNFSNSLPIIALYAFAGYRLMPALQQVYASFTQFSFVGPSLDRLVQNLKKLNSVRLNHSKTPVLFEQKIELENISFIYPNSEKTSLKDINISIPARTTIGLVGPTGSGKTSLVDIILGLLESQKGCLKVDGKIINQDNCKAWQSRIGYVPQHIFLLDDTLEANIALGANPDNIDQKKIEKSSKIANLYDFVLNELPNQFKTKIGERGVRLSGGQRQRVGIARALYNEPEVLILDEATSALDNQTEKNVMEAINKLGKNITIIIVAHRLSTVKNCDEIFILEKGKIKNQGNFDKLINIDKNFRINAIN